MEYSPFLTFAPNKREAFFRKLGHTLPYSYIGRKAASLFLGPAGGRSGTPRDVSIFKSMRARLHPHDNICEKRVYLTPQHWDQQERSALATAIANTSTTTERPFTFLDIGANAGLYSLFALDVAHRKGIPFRALCLEPDPVMHERLLFNIAVSKAHHEVTPLRAAISDHDGEVSFSSANNSRGMNQIDQNGDHRVPCFKLSSVLSDQNITHIDAMKMDIEGHEYKATQSLLEIVEKTTWPSLIILETSHEKKDASASSLFQEAGYQKILQTKLNAVLIKQAP